MAKPELPFTRSTAAPYNRGVSILALFDATRHPNAAMMRIRMRRLPRGAVYRISSPSNPIVFCQLACDMYLLVFHVNILQLAQEMTRSAIGH
jgi:arginine deiminase